MLLAREELVVALLALCRERRVPVPRSGEKRLIGHPPGLALAITLGKPPGGGWPVLAGRVA